MADPMRRPMPGPAPGPAPGGMPGGPTPPMGKSDSIFNPADAMKQKAAGMMGPEMTIREFFEAQGLDVDTNTIADLAQWGKQQAQNRTMQGKLGAGAGAPSPGMGAGTTPPPAAPSPGMEGLVNRI